MSFKCNRLAKACHHPSWTGSNSLEMPTYNWCLLPSAQHQPLPACLPLSQPSPCFPTLCMALVRHCPCSLGLLWKWKLPFIYTQGLVTFSEQEHGLLITESNQCLSLTSTGRRLPDSWPHSVACEGKHRKLLTCNHYLTSVSLLTQGLPSLNISLPLSCLDVHAPHIRFMWEGPPGCHAQPVLGL